MRDTLILMNAQEMYDALDMAVAAGATERAGCIEDFIRETFADLEE